LRKRAFQAIFLAMSLQTKGPFTWLRSGREALERMLAAMGEARESVRLEVYYFAAGPATEPCRRALIEACRRGVRVQVLVDAGGPLTLPESFWDGLRDAGGEFRWFNPMSLHRWSIRDHRKILVCDGEVGFIGGFNMAAEYHGDGVKEGWRELGLEARGPMAGELAAAFDDMFGQADLRQRRFSRRRKPVGATGEPKARLLLGGPGRNNPIKRALLADLKGAQSVRIMTPYFFPPWGIRRELRRVAGRGGRVQLILPGKTDVLLARLATRSYYRRLLEAGVEIYEYQPQILHAKMFLIDGVVYAGSANLNKRSLGINYELMLRLAEGRVAREAGQIFEGDLAHCRRMEAAGWRKSRTFWDRLQARLARFILGWADPFVGERQWRRAGLRGRRRAHLAKATK
jgi:cardiolipin synthase A/B